ncbi:Mechanosensitive ion channel [Pseudomonas punonensis]|uniref:Mechanosensitive ion channel n=2 Tax=Phytopseudomonas punonensis TaxID=1220495 RepID=A0A1M7G8S8_9GAMM|nr:Mechanosensitive ion channel [Pseudomonas punonensis]
MRVMQNLTLPYTVWWWVTAAFLMCITGLTNAAPFTDSTVTPDTPSTRAEPIALTHILERAEEDQQRVDWAKRLLASPDPVEHLSVSLNDIARPVHAKQQTSHSVLYGELPVMRIESLARHWHFDARRLERWEMEARRAFGPYSGSALQLAQRRSVWASTQAAGLLDELPPVLSDRIDSILMQITAAESGLSDELARQFALMQQASDLKALIEAGSNEVAAALDDLDRRLLRVDVAPLWQGFGPRTEEASSWSAIWRGLEIEEQFARDYHSAGTRNQQALTLLQILLLPLILWLVVRSRRTMPQKQEVHHMARALRRPFSTWLLLCMLAVLVIEPDAPLLAQEAALLVALIPVLRLLPSGVLRALGMWPYIAIAMYGLDRLGIVTAGDTEIYRTYLLAMTGLALMLTLWLLWHAAPSAQKRDSRLQRIMRPIGWAASAMLMVAVAANILGNISLAETLTSGVIDSGYMALLLYAGVSACVGLFRALLGQPELANRHFVLHQEVALQSAFTRLLMFGAAIGWLLYSMDRFRVLRPLYSVSSAVMEFGIEVGEVSVNLGDLLVFMLSAWLALWAARVVRRLLRAELPNHAKLPRGVGNSIASLSYYAVLLFGLLVSLSAAGFKVSQLALIFGALGVGIGFGLQNVVNNFVSGLVLMFERPIQPGDLVDAAGTAGTVREISLRSTIIRTADGADVVVPNGMLLNCNLTNWTMFDKSRRIEIPVHVAYGSAPLMVMSVLSNALREVPGVAEQPAPLVMMTGYGDGALNFTISAWTHDISIWAKLRGEILTRLLAALQQAGISVPYRLVDVNLHNVQEQKPLQPST